MRNYLFHHTVTVFWFTTPTYHYSVQTCWHGRAGPGRAPLRDGGCPYLTLYLHTLHPQVWVRVYCVTFWFTLPPVRFAQHDGRCGGTARLPFVQFCVHARLHTHAVLICTLAFIHHIYLRYGWDPQFPPLYIPGSLPHGLPTFPGSDTTFTHTQLPLVHSPHTFYAFPVHTPHLGWLVTCSYTFTHTRFFVVRLPVVVYVGLFVGLFCSLRLQTLHAFPFCRIPTRYALRWLHLPHTFVALFVTYVALPHHLYSYTHTPLHLYILPWLVYATYTHITFSWFGCYSFTVWFPCTLDTAFWLVRGYLYHSWFCYLRSRFSSQFL